MQTLILALSSNPLGLFVVCFELDCLDLLIGRYVYRTSDGEGGG